MDLLKKYRQLKKKVEAASNKPEGRELADEAEKFEQFLTGYSKEIEKYRKIGFLYENADESIFIHDEEGKILEVNLTACKTYQYNKSEMLNLNYYDLVAPVFRNYSLKRKKELIKNSLVRFESLHKNKNKETFFVEIEAKKISWYGQDVIMSICRDLKEQERREMLSLEKDFKLNEIVEQVRDGIVIFDESGNILIWNTGAENITGISAEDVINQKLPDIQYKILHGRYKNKEFIIEKFNEVVSLSNPGIYNKIIDNDIFLPEKGIRNIQATIFPVFLDSGSYLFGSVMRDITEQKQTENQLKELNDTKDKIFSIIAHDLRSPFNNIISVTDLLIKNIEKYDINKISKLLKQISLTAYPTLNILDNLLDLAVSQDEKKMVSNLEKIELEPFIHELTEFMDMMAKNKNISLRYFIPEKIELEVNPVLFKSVLRNLLTNALKFTPVNGKVEIFAVKKDGNVLVTVSDTGIGMDKRFMNKLFQIDLNVTSYGTEGEKGSGIGLVLCKEIVEKHGGKIWAESEPGKGSKFLVSLPGNV